MDAILRFFVILSCAAFVVSGRTRNKPHGGNEANAQCSKFRGICHHKCVDVSNGNFRCQCHDGYRLLPNKRSCRRIKILYKKLNPTDRFQYNSTAHRQHNINGNVAQPKGHKSLHKTTAQNSKTSAFLFSKRTPRESRGEDYKAQFSKIYDRRNISTNYRNFKKLRFGSKVGGEGNGIDGDRKKKINSIQKPFLQGTSYNQRISSEAVQPSENTYRNSRVMGKKQVLQRAGKRKDENEKEIRFPENKNKEKLSSQDRLKRLRNKYLTRMKRKRNGEIKRERNSGQDNTSMNGEVGYGGEVQNNLDTANIKNSGKDKYGYNQHERKTYTHHSKARRRYEDKYAREKSDRHPTTVRNSPKYRKSFLLHGTLKPSGNLRNTPSILNNKYGNDVVVKKRENRVTNQNEKTDAKFSHRPHNNQIDKRGKQFVRTKSITMDGYLNDQAGVVDSVMKDKQSDKNNRNLGRDGYSKEANNTDDVTNDETNDDMNDENNVNNNQILFENKTKASHQMRRMDIFDGSNDDAAQRDKIKDQNFIENERVKSDQDPKANGERGQSGKESDDDNDIDDDNIDDGPNNKPRNSESIPEIQQSINFETDRTRSSAENVISKKIPNRTQKDRLSFRDQILRRLQENYLDPKLAALLRSVRRHKTNMSAQNSRFLSPSLKTTTTLTITTPISPSKSSSYFSPLPLTTASTLQSAQRYDDSVTTTTISTASNAANQVGKIGTSKSVSKMPISLPEPNLANNLKPTTISKADEQGAPITTASPIQNQSKSSKVQNPTSSKQMTTRNLISSTENRFTKGDITTPEDIPYPKRRSTINEETSTTRLPPGRDESVEKPQYHYQNPSIRQEKELLRNRATSLKRGKFSLSMLEIDTKIRSGEREHEAVATFSGSNPTSHSGNEIPKNQSSRISYKSGQEILNLDDYRDRNSKLKSPYGSSMDYSTSGEKNKNYNSGDPYDKTNLDQKSIDATKNSLVDIKVKYHHLFGLSKTSPPPKMKIKLREIPKYVEEDERLNEKLSLVGARSESSPDYRTVRRIAKPCPSGLTPVSTPVGVICKFDEAKIASFLEDNPFQDPNPGMSSTSLERTILTDNPLSKVKFRALTDAFEFEDDALNQEINHKSYNKKDLQFDNDDATTSAIDEAVGGVWSEGQDDRSVEDIDDVRAGADEYTSYKCRVDEILIMTHGVAHCKRLEENAQLCGSGFKARRGKNGLYVCAEVEKPVLTCPQGFYASTTQGPLLCLPSNPHADLCQDPGFVSLFGPQVDCTGKMNLSSILVPCEEGYRAIKKVGHEGGHLCRLTDFVEVTCEDIPGRCFPRQASSPPCNHSNHSNNNISPCQQLLDLHKSGCQPPCANGGRCLEQLRLCQCPPGLTGVACQKDIDECSLRPQGYCQYDCVNTFGSFYCSCPPGFTLNGDHRTCTVSNCFPGCENGGTCYQGRCSCLAGFKGRLCDLDIDECRKGSQLCQGKCLNTFGSYTCVCPPGSRLDHTNGRTCINTTCSPPCVNGGQCVHSQCLCEPGYTGRFCQLDVNECRLDKNKKRCSHACVNTRGSFRCVCPRGFHLHSDGVMCEAGKEENGEHFVPSVHDSSIE